MTPVLRPAVPADAAAIAGVYGHHVEHSVATFDVVRPTVADREAWLAAHAGGRYRVLVVEGVVVEGVVEGAVVEGAVVSGAVAGVVGAGGGGRGRREVLGFAASSRLRDRPAYDTTVETSVYLAPHAVGRGLGRALYTALFAALADEDVHRAFAAVALPNPASEALHRAAGFRQVGTFGEVGHKFGRFIDVGWFQKDL